MNNDNTTILRNDITTKSSLHDNFSIAILYTVNYEFILKQNNFKILNKIYFENKSNQIRNDFNSFFTKTFVTAACGKWYIFSIGTWIVEKIWDGQGNSLEFVLPFIKQ